jgi:hypothetical protein
MGKYTYKNIITGETKEVISALSFVLADEFFGCKYYYTNDNWQTIELTPCN